MEKSVMRAREFAKSITIKESYFRTMRDGVQVNVSFHAKERAAERGVPWPYVLRIINNLDRITPQLRQLYKFDKFRIRDEETWTDLGCRIVEAPNGMPLLYINTVVRQEPGMRYDMPVIRLEPGKLHESLLQEYNREKTAGVFGKKLIAALVNDRSVDSRIGMLKDILKQQDPNTNTEVLNRVMAMLESADPTANKEYVQWLAKVYANEGVKMEDLLSKTTEWLQKYDLYKKKRFFTGPDAKLANIMNLSWKDLWEVSIRADYQMKVQQADEKAMPRGDAELVYENDKVRIVIPKDREAACYYGQGTQWCTAATQSTNYFANYSNQGPLYILLPKSPKYAGEKYQLHFPSGQFMDEQDNSVDNIFDLLEMRFGNLVPFFREREPEINDWLVFTPDEILEPLIEKIKTAVNDHLSELVSEYEIDDDYWYQSLRDEGYVYPEGHEDEGQIDWDKVADADISYLDFATDLQDLIEDVNNAVDLTPEEVRNLAAEVASEWGADTQEIRDLDKIFAYSVENIRSRSRDGDGGVPEWINKHVYVKKLDTGWTVTIIYHDKDGKAREYEIRS